MENAPLDFKSADQIIPKYIIFKKIDSWLEQKYYVDVHVFVTIAWLTLNNGHFIKHFLEIDN